MIRFGQDQLKTRQTFEVDGKTYNYYSIPQAQNSIGDVTHLPFSLRVILENLLRFEDGTTVSTEDIKTLASWGKSNGAPREIAYRPARVLMQDFTGVPAVVDLATMRQAVKDLGGDPNRINPLSPVDLVIDHSVVVDRFANASAFKENVEFEFERNTERYGFLKWGQESLDNFRVVPPGTGICHQVNLEYIGKTVWSRDVNGETFAFPDTLVGTDSHTTMINGLAVLGWGVGGIEAEAAMLGQPITMLIPDVIGFKITGKAKEGTTATDIVLTVTEMLRKHGVVGKFVEFFGPGLASMSIADRATIANMAPEYGATCGFFPIDQETIRYLEFTGRDAHEVRVTEAYAKAQGMWRDSSTPDPIFTDTLELDLSTVQPCVAGPTRPQDRIVLSELASSAKDCIAQEGKTSTPTEVTYNNETFTIDNGSVMIAAITSCTNTSNPSVMLAAGLVARNARAKGLKTQPWVKTSLAPGSQVVTDYLDQAGLTDDLDALGFNLVGYGCTTCIGNSGPLPDPIAKAVNDSGITVAGVLSGNRNFEGRIHPQLKMNYLASPPLVVAYALAGSVNVDLYNDPIGTGSDGQPVYLKDIWPTNTEIQEVVDKCVTSQMFTQRYADVFNGDNNWRQLPGGSSITYDWQGDSTYVKHPPFFEGMQKTPGAVSNISGARPLAILGNSVTTDHISPAGAIPLDSPTATYLQENGVEPKDFNSYGSRRGNHEVMMRGTFGNIRLRNEMVPGTHGGVTRFMPSGSVMSIYEAAMQYKEQGTPLVVVAGKEYGTGSSRDWAAKGTRLLGVRAVIAESFERIHRSNLIGMGVLPLVFTGGVNRLTLDLDGSETFDITGIEGKMTPGMEIGCTITRRDGSQESITLKSRLDTENEIEYYLHDGILHYVIRNILTSNSNESPSSNGHAVGA